VFEERFLAGVGFTCSTIEGYQDGGGRRSLGSRKTFEADLRNNMPRENTGSILRMASGGKSLTPIGVIDDTIGVKASDIVPPGTTVQFDPVPLPPAPPLPPSSLTVQGSLPSLYTFFSKPNR
jgi:hypothetical protein